MSFIMAVKPAIRLLVIAGGVLYGSMLMATNTGFLKYSVVAGFTEADMNQLQKEYLFALDSKKPGEVYAWKNKESGNGGELTIIKRYKQEEKECRRMRFKTYSASQSAVTRFNFCLFGSDWKLVN